MTNQNTPVLLQKDITDQVNGKLATLKSEGLHLPAGYASANALKSAFFELQEVQDRNKKPALEVCTKESIANTLLDMVVQGLSPAKKQCYFIVYGNKLQLNRSYFGTQVVLKRLSNVKDIWANVIYKGDTFDIEIINGRETLKEHKTAFENRDNEIIGAYCIIEKTDGERVLTTMTKKEIDKSWSKAKTKNVQNDFPQEMAKRTVINRAAKAFVNTSDDSDLLIEAINNTTANEYQDDNERKEAEIIDEIDQNANSEVLDPKPAEAIEEPKVDEAQEQPPFIEPDPQEDVDPYA
ncbi:recombinase RecT [Enterococcus avium]|uniref:recombinase RecT n=1 Tax=Enterococcus avium TaxID=33945 RepID=UPI003DA4FF98